MAEDSHATFGSLFKAYWPDADHKEAAKRADEAAAAVLRFTKDRSFFAQLLAASIALHLVLLAGLLWLERAPPLKPDLTKEIPVDLVAQPPSGSGPPGAAAGSSHAAAKPAAKPAPPKPAPSPAAPKPAAAKPPAPSAPKLAPKPDAKPEPPKPEPPKPAPPKPAPPKPQPPKLAPPTAQPPKSAPPKPEPPKPEPTKPEATKPEAAKPLPKLAPPPVQAAPKPAPPPAPPPQAIKPPSPTPTAPAQTANAPQVPTQDDSPAVTVPRPSDDGDEIVSYQTLVFGILELKKQFPADALRRGAFGTAMVYFDLNDDGSVKSEKLLRSSGDAALDVESLALIQRAAPFPKPPPGAQKFFAVDITFPKPN